MLIRMTAATFAACVVCSGASAASYSWTSYAQADLATAQTFRANNVDTDVQVAFEDFESFSPVPNNGGPGTATPLATNVGTFTTTPGNNSGNSASAPFNESLIRDTSNFGRYNTTSGGSNWLDSNDNSAINLAGSAGGMFDSISFFLTDIDDVGLTTFNIDVDGQNFDIAADIFGGSRQQNGDLFLVSIDLGSAVASVNLGLNIDAKDGFGLDDIRLGNSAPGVPPIPVPASLPLLAGALGVLGWGARRRRKAA